MGADMSIVNDTGWTPLFAALCNGNVEVANMLEKWADIAIAGQGGKHAATFSNIQRTCRGGQAAA